MTTRGEINSNFYQIVDVDSNGAPTLIKRQYIPGQLEVAFNYGDATPKTVGTVPAGSVITDVSLVILTGLNDTMSTISVGTNSNVSQLMATTDNTTSVAGTYTTEPAYKYITQTQIVMAISPGTSSVGNGILIINYQ